MISWIFSTNQSAQMFKLSVRFDPAPGLFIGTFEPILSAGNRNTLCAYNPSCFTSAHRIDLSITEISEKGRDMLGLGLSKVEGRSLYSIASPESLKIIREKHVERNLIVI